MYICCVYLQSYIHGIDRHIHMQSASLGNFILGLSTSKYLSTKWRPPQVYVLVYWCINPINYIYVDTNIYVYPNIYVLDMIHQ